MSDAFPDSKKKVVGRTIYDKVADLKKERVRPPIKQAVKRKLPHLHFQEKLQELQVQKKAKMTKDEEEKKEWNQVKENVSYWTTPNGDVKDIWEALYREEKEIEEILAKRK